MVMPMAVHLYAGIRYAGKRNLAFATVEGFYFILSFYVLVYAFMKATLFV